MIKSISPKKQYIVRKVILADSFEDALRQEKNHPITEVYIDADYKDPLPLSNMGYKM